MFSNLQLSKQLRWEKFTIVKNPKWFKLDVQFDGPWGRG